MAKVIYKNEEELKNTKEKLYILKFSKRKEGKVSVSLKSKKK
ncbi:MAG: hypothetical protein ABIJ80_03085 [Patescibacteria group bacterium]